MFSFVENEEYTMLYHENGLRVTWIYQGEASN